MNKANDDKIENFTYRIVKIGAFATLALTLMIFGVAVIGRSTKGEPSNGSFDAADFNDGWTLIYDNKQSVVTLPTSVDSKPDDEVILTKSLPDDLSDGMSLMIRASMQDVFVYVNNTLRDEYSAGQLDGVDYYLPSAYVVVPLNEEDSGADIAIRLTIKNKGVINAITIGHGNNVWFDVLKDALPLSAFAIFVLIGGLVMSLSVLILRKRYVAAAAGWLGLLIASVSLWLLSESTIRQILFNRPSLSHYLSFLTGFLMNMFACMYFDSVQHKVYHRRYLILEIAVLINTVVSIVLDFAGIYVMFQSVWITHVISAITSLVVVVNIITDCITKRIQKYKINVIGLLFFAAMAVLETALFYMPWRVVFGTALSFGFIVLLITTLLQTLYDISDDFRTREKKKIAMTINTIETIAGAIDARDEYTGGHSERVALYAGLLAKEMGADYNLTDEDILRIGYIGLVHDIGKIGVADDVLNKAGKLTDEEYSLMKRHTEIGYGLMISLGDEIQGMLDGIRNHHERYDGTGYPDRLSGKDIPLVARILALADTYDAMTSNRVYRKRLTDEEVRNELIRCSGTQFDPALTEIFVGLIDKGKLRADTADGIATDSEGKLRLSSVLENRLSHDLQKNVAVINPSYIRMLCYILKLTEKMDKTYRVIIISVESHDWPTIKHFEKSIATFLGQQDVNIKYTVSSYVIALYERTDEEEAAFIDAVKKAYDNVHVEKIE